MNWPAALMITSPAHFIRTIASFTATLAALAAPVEQPIAPSAGSAPSAKATTGTVTTASRAVGSDLRTPDGRLVGVVSEVIVNRNSGRIAYFAVTASEAGSTTETLRLLPARHIQRATFDPGFATDIAADAWEDLPVLSESILSGQVRTARAVADENPIPSDPAGRQAETETGRDEPFVRVARLRGQSARTPHGALAIIQDVELDLKHGVAVAMITTPGRNPDRGYAIPLRELKISPGASADPASLFEPRHAEARSLAGPRRQGIAEAEAPDAGAAAGSRTHPDASLSPTGRADSPKRASPPELPSSKAGVGNRATGPGPGRHD